MNNILTVPAECRPFLTDTDIAELDQLQRMQQTRTLRIAVLGQFSTGKSSLINALLARPMLLPTRTTETTAVMTELRAGTEDAVIAYTHDGIAESLALGKLSEYVQGKHGIDTIASLALTVAGTALPAELELIDTPGSNTLHAKHLEFAYAAIARAELAIYVFTAAGLSQADVVYLRHILQFQPHILFVLNRIDELLVTGEGESLLDIVVHLEKELRDALGIDPEIYPVSCTTGSGMAELRATLFEEIPCQLTRFKEEVAHLRMAQIHARIAERLTEELQQIACAEQAGVEGLAQERRALEAQRAEVDTRLARRRQHLLGEWHALRQERGLTLQRERTTLQAHVSAACDEIMNSTQADRVLRDVQSWVLDFQERFYAETGDCLVERVATDFNLQLAELPALGSDILHIDMPEVGQLIAQQAERLRARQQSLDELIQRYHQLAAIPAEQVTPEQMEKIVALEAEMNALKEQLNLPFEPQYTERLDPNAVSWADNLARVGQFVDYATILIPVVGEAKIGQVVLKEGVKAGLEVVKKEGVKAVAKQAAKEISASVVKGAKKIIADPTRWEGWSKMLPKRKKLPPWVKLLELCSVEGIARQIGQTIDNMNLAANTQVVEDDAYRQAFHQQKQEMQHAYLQKQQVLRREHSRMQAADLTSRQRTNQQEALQRLISEEQQALAELEKCHALQHEREMQQQMRDAALRAGYTYLAREMHAIESWLIAQSALLESAVSDGLQRHFQEAFEEVEAVTRRVEETYNVSQSALAQRKSQLQLALQAVQPEVAA